jgi:hypothetical protein
MRNISAALQPANKLYSGGAEKSAKLIERFALPAKITVMSNL